VNRSIDGHSRYWAKLMIDVRTEWTNPIRGNYHANFARGHAEPGSGFPPDRFDRLLLEHVNFRWFSAAVTGQDRLAAGKSILESVGNVSILRRLAATAIKSMAWSETVVRSC
jgi:hypothetical protein